MSGDHRAVRFSLLPLPQGGVAVAWSRALMSPRSLAQHRYAASASGKIEQKGFVNAFLPFALHDCAMRYDMLGYQRREQHGHHCGDGRRSLARRKRRWRAMLPCASWRACRRSISVPFRSPTDQSDGDRGGRNTFNAAMRNTTPENRCSLMQQHTRAQKPAREKA